MSYTTQGKQLVFVTNNSTKSRAGYLKKFTSLGLNVNAEEVYSSSYAAAAYLESIKFPKDKKVYIVGEVGIVEELDLKVPYMLLLLLHKSYRVVAIIIF